MSTEEERAERAAYMREYRKRDPERYATAKQIQRARERALRTLGRRHTAELRELIDHEIVREEP